MEIVAIYIGVGALAGVTSGLFGVGGGVIVVPVLLLVFTLLGFPSQVLTHMALATSLAAMVITSASSAWAHFQRKAVLISVFAWMAAGVLVGAFAGVSLAVNLAGSFLQIAFGFFLALVGLQMLAGFRFSRDAALPKGPVLALTGAVIGLVSMLFGIGGGSMTVPFLNWRGISPKRAVATSAALGLPIALFGAILYGIKVPAASEMPKHSTGYIYWPALLGLVVASIPATRLGARLAHSLRPSSLRMGFGIFVLLMSVNLLWKNLGA